MDGTGDQEGIPGRRWGLAYDTYAVKGPKPAARSPWAFGPNPHRLEVLAVPTEPDEVELTVVVMAFLAADPEALVGVLAKYVVLARGHPGCRNIDLVASVTHPGRLLVIQKWATPEAQRAHFDSADMVEMAGSCRGLLAEPPDIDLLDAISAHDLA